MRLDKLSRDDHEAYLKIVGDPSTGNYDDEFPKVGAVADESFEESLADGICPDVQIGVWRELAIRSAEGELVGLTSYRVDRGADKLKARVGVHLHTDHRGKGYAVMALLALYGFFRTSTEIDLVDAIVAPGNAASIKMLERSGLTRVGKSGVDHLYLMNLRRN